MAAQGDDALRRAAVDMSSRGRRGRRGRGAFHRTRPPRAGGGAHVLFARPWARTWTRTRRRPAAATSRRRGHLKLDAQLVLDHKSRYRRPVVAGPTAAGGAQGDAALVRCVRPAGAVAAARPGRRSGRSRGSVLSTLWSADPPGWPLSAASPWAPNLRLVPLLADLRAGVPAATRTEIEDRIAKVEVHDGKAGRGAAAGQPRHPAVHSVTWRKLAGYRGFAESLLAGRENGLGLASGTPSTPAWHPRHPRWAGRVPSLVALRAARSW